MNIMSKVSCIVLVACSFSCGGSKKSNPGPEIEPPIQIEPTCTAAGLSSNSCLNQQKLALAGIKDLDLLAAQMAAVTVSCKPTPAEFKEFLCQFKP